MGKGITNINGHLSISPLNKRDIATEAHKNDRSTDLRCRQGTHYSLRLEAYVATEAIISHRDQKQTWPTRQAVVAKATNILGYETKLTSERSRNT